MKKLMMALVAVAFGCAAQAAVVNWGSKSAIKEVSAADGTQGGAALTTAYTAILTIIGDEGVELVSVADQGYSLGKLKVSSFEPAAGLTGDQTYAYTLVISGPVSNNTKNYADYIGKDATLTVSGEVTINSTGDTTLTIDTSAAKWSVESVPEPTSGLLLLLGVAGLALKRRRA